MDTSREKLQHLRKNVLALGAMVESAVVESVDAFQRRAPIGMTSLITLDHQIVRKRFNIELDCITLIATQQPANSDLRAITSMLEIATELERIGEYITAIANIHILVVQIEEPLRNLFLDIRQMAVKVQGMLHRVLEALEEQDLSLAWTVYSEDDEIDVLYRQVYRSTLDYMRGKSHKAIKQARYLSQITRNLERAADRVTNICEWIIFAATGAMVDNGNGLVSVDGPVSAGKTFDAIEEARI